MAEQAQMLLNWTPSSDATSQEVHRSLSSSGPWTVIATVGAAVSSYTDTTVDPTPFTTYYYIIKTICADGSSATIPSSDVCQNCPTEGDTFVFGGRNKTLAQVYADYTWTSGTNQWMNTNWGTSLPTIAQYNTLNNDDGTSTNKFLFCASCGDDVNTNSSMFTPGTLDADFSYMENQAHIAAQLPIAPAALGGNANNNLGEVYRKFSAAGTWEPFSGRFTFGIAATNSSTFTGWNGGYVSTNTNEPYGSNPPTGYFWNWGEMPSNTAASNGGFTQIRINKQIFAVSGSYGDQSFALGAMSGNNVYMSIIDEANTGTGVNGQSAGVNGHLRCEHYMYKLTRNSALDGPNSTGFNIQLWNIVTYNRTAISNPTHGGAYKPYNYNAQPTTYLKIFTI